MYQSGYYANNGTLQDEFGSTEIDPNLIMNSNNIQGYYFDEGSDKSHEDLNLYRPVQQQAQQQQQQQQQHQQNMYSNMSTPQQNNYNTTPVMGQTPIMNSTNTNDYHNNQGQMYGNNRGVQQQQQYQSPQQYSNVPQQQQQYQQQQQQPQQPSANQQNQFMNLINNMTNSMNNSNVNNPNYLNKMYNTGSGEPDLLPFSDEKKLILLSALSGDNLFRGNIQSMFNQLQQQQQQQQQQQVNFQLFQSLLSNNNGNGNGNNNQPSNPNVFNSQQQQPQQQQNLYNQQQSTPQQPIQQPTPLQQPTIPQQPVQQPIPLQQPSIPQQQAIPQQQPVPQQQAIPQQPPVQQQSIPSQQPAISSHQKFLNDFRSQMGSNSTNSSNSNNNNNNNNNSGNSAFQVRSTPLPTPVATPPSTSINRQQQFPSPPITPSISSIPASIPQSPTHLKSLPDPSMLYQMGLDFDDSHLTEKQKSKRRASQNLASRNYRQRKKAYMSEIEAKLEVIILENEKLKNELTISKRYIDKLLQENNQLKGVQPKKSDIPGCTGEEEDDDPTGLLGSSSLSNETDSSSDLNGFTSQSSILIDGSTCPRANSSTCQDTPPEPDISVLIDQLEAGMKLSSPETTELATTLKTFYNTLKNRQNIYIKQIKQVVNPCTQAKLALLDLDVNSTMSNPSLSCQQSPQQPSPPSVHDLEIPSSPAVVPLQDLIPSSWLIEFIKEGSVNADQELRIRQLRQESLQQHTRILKEREIFKKEIREYYQSKVFKHLIKRTNKRDLQQHTMMEDSSSPSVGHSYFTELSELLDSLKENLDQENFLLLSTYEALGNILSPYQEALLITKVYNSISDDGDDFSNVQMLHGIWDTFSIFYENRSSITTPNSYVR